MFHLLIEDLPREAARLLEHDSAILRVRVIAKIRALIDEALALRVDHDAERIAVTITGMWRIHVAEIRRIALPRDRMAARPLTVRLRADVERHRDAVAGVVTRPAHFREIPTRAKVASAHFAIRFKAAAREHDGA